MFRTLLITTAIIVLVACGIESKQTAVHGGPSQIPNENLPQLTQSVIRPVHDLSYMNNAIEILDFRKVYNFDDGLTHDLHFVVDNEYVQEPELSNGQLSLLPNGHAIAATAGDSLISNLTFEGLVKPNNSLVRLRLEGNSSMPAGQSMSLAFGLVAGLYPSLTVKPVPFLFEDLAYLAHYNWLPVGESYDVNLSLMRAWKEAFNSTGYEVNFDKIVAESYPLKVFDWQDLRQSAEVYKWATCDKELSSLTAKGSVSFLDNDTFHIEGSVSDGSSEIITFNLNETLVMQNQVRILGVADSAWPGHEGVFTAWTVLRDLSEISIAIAMDNCEVIVQINNDLKERLNDALWQTEAVVDFSRVADLSEIDLNWVQPDVSTKPIVADYSLGKALLLTPQSIRQNSQYLHDYENHEVATLTIDDLDPSTSLIEIEVDLFGYPGENDGCERTRFSAYVNSETAIEGLNVYAQNYTIYHESQRVFISPNVESINLSISAGGDYCVVDPSHQVFIDNLTIRQFKFPTHPFAGEWEISLSTNSSDVCTLGDASDLLVLGDDLAPFDITLANGAKVTGMITADGEFKGSGTVGDYQFDFDSQFFHAEVARAYSEDENGCPYFVNIHRPSLLN